MRQDISISDAWARLLQFLLVKSEVEGRSNRAGQRYEQVENDKANGRGIELMEGPKQNHVCRNVESIQNGDRDAPRLHIPNTVGIAQQESAEEPAEDEVRQFPVKPMPEDHEAEMSGMRMLEDLGEIRKRQHDEQNRHDG